MNRNLKLDILGIIPARGGSKGIPNKNTRQLNGRPLVEYTFRAAKDSKRLTRTIITTDSLAIAQLAYSHQIEVPFIRPSELSKDETVILSVIHHAIDWLAKNENYIPTIIVLLQPTSPLRTSSHIDEAIDLLTSSNSDSVVSVTEVPGYFNPYWQFIINEGLLSTFTGENFSDLITQRQKLPLTYTRNGAIYAFWSKNLEKKGSIYGKVCKPYIMPSAESINIDSMDDWIIAEHRLKSRLIREI